MELVFATNNKHKLEEISALAGEHFVIRGLEEIGISEEIPEEQDTLSGNASQKSWFIHDRTGVNCFADDTGLEIEALDSRPGVISARYAGSACSPQDNMDKVLAEMQGITNRAARFRTVISLIINGTEHQFEGIVEGKILTERHGDEGFGYDPIFIPDGFTQSFAQMPLSEKNKISHRGRATQKLIAFLKEQH